MLHRSGFPLYTVVHALSQKKLQWRLEPGSDFSGVFFFNYFFYVITCSASINPSPWSPPPHTHRTVSMPLLTFHRTPCLCGKVVTVRQHPAAPAECRGSGRAVPLLHPHFQLTGASGGACSCAPRLTLLWPICRNSIPSQPRDPRSLQRDNSSP